MEVQIEVHISQSLTHFTIQDITKVTNFGVWRESVRRIVKLFLYKVFVKVLVFQFPWYFSPLLVPQCERDGRLLPEGDGRLHHPRQVLHQRPGPRLLKR